MTRPEDLLSDALHERVDHRDLPSTPMSDVVATARGIRRHRRARNAAVTAALVAVLATPFVIAATSSPDRSTGPIDTPTPEPAAHVRLADVGLGEPPAVAWLDGNVYVAADGTRTTLPVDDVTTATPYRGGFLVAVTGPDLGPRVVLLDSELKQVWRRCGQGSFAVSDGGLRTAYSTGDCRSPVLMLRLGVTEVPATVSSPLVAQEKVEQLPVEQSGPAGIIDETVVTGSLPDAPSLVVDFDDDPTPIGSLEQVGSVDGDRSLVAGQLAGHPSTAAVIDADDGTVVWERRGWALDDFSPDGSMVLGARTGSDGSGWGIFDAKTGEQLHEFAMPRGFVSDAVVWEDEEHLLMTTTQGHVQAILRTTLDGAIRRATETVPYDGGTDDPRFHFAPRP